MLDKELYVEDDDALWGGGVNDDMILNQVMMELERRVHQTELESGAKTGLMVEDMTMGDQWLGRTSMVEDDEGNHGQVELGTMGLVERCD